MKTNFTTIEAARANRKWFVVDLEGETLGRAAAKIAHVLRGKHKPTWTPHNDDGDFVVVVNAAKVVLTGNKWANKKYYRYSGHIGGLKVTTAEKLRKVHPDDLLRLAVKGMLPSGPLGRAQLRKLKIYGGSAHPHAAQQCEPLDLSKLLVTST